MTTLPAPIVGLGSRSASDHASRVTNELAVLDHHLRNLLGEEKRPPADPAESAPDDNGQETVVNALIRTGGQLARTIVGATGADWERATTVNNRWVVDLIIVTLHDADHELHDAERVLHAALAIPNRPRTTGRCRATAGDPPLRMR